MSADKRTVHTDALATLGMIHDGEQKRDAIHLAVIQAKACGIMARGTDVVVRDGVAYAVERGTGHGIIDPFLPCPVPEGGLCWVVIYPRVITSLRHVWSHPAFPDEAGCERAPTSEAEASRRWIADYAATIPLAVDVLMDGARDWVADKRRGGWGEYLCFGGLLEGLCVPDEFWPHFERVEGERVAEEHRGSFFSCSC